MLSRNKVMVAEAAVGLINFLSIFSALTLIVNVEYIIIIILILSIFFTPLLIK